MFNSASLYPARSLLSRIRARQSAAAGVENAGADPRERESKGMRKLEVQAPGPTSKNWRALCAVAIYVHYKHCLRGVARTLANNVGN